MVPPINGKCFIYYCIITHFHASGKLQKALETSGIREFSRLSGILEIYPNSIPFLVNICLRLIFFLSTFYNAISYTYNGNFILIIFYFYYLNNRKDLKYF